MANEPLNGKSEYSKDDEEAVWGQIDQPLQKGEVRGCTDIMCLALFALFVIAHIAVTSWAFAEGDYRRVVNGIDFAGCKSYTVVLERLVAPRNLDPGE